jgi:hypothetical protein
MVKRQKDRQHNGQKTEEQTTQWSKDRRTDNTMVKRQKNRQHNSQKTEEQTTQWSKDRRTDNTQWSKGKGQKAKTIYKTKNRVTSVNQVLIYT